MHFEIGVLRNFAKLIGKQLRWNLFLITLQTLGKETPHLRATAFVLSQNSKKNTSYGVLFLRKPSFETFLSSKKATLLYYRFLRVNFRHFTEQSFYRIQLETVSIGTWPNQYEIDLPVFLYKLCGTLVVALGIIHFVLTSISYREIKTVSRTYLMNDPW